MTPRWRNGSWERSPEDPEEHVDWEDEGFSEDTEDPGDDVGVV